MTDKKPSKKPARKQPAKKVPAKKLPAKLPAKKTPAKVPAKAPVKTPARKVAAKTVTKAAGKGVPPKKVTDAARATQAAAKSVIDVVGEAKRAVGRPTLYSDDMIPQMLAYFNIETERTEEVMVPDKNGVAVPVLETVVNKYPTLERFAAKIGVTRKTLHEWATDTYEDGSLKRPEFSYTYARAKDLSTALLIEGGLAGNYESRVVVFALKNLSGWKEQIEATIESSVVEVTKERLDEIYEKGIANAKAARAAALARTLDGIVPGSRS